MFSSPSQTRDVYTLLKVPFVNAMLKSVECAVVIIEDMFRQMRSEVLSQRI